MKKDLDQLERYTKALSRDKEEIFKEYFLKRLSEEHIVRTDRAHVYMIYSTRHGMIDIYPVNNRCFLNRRQQPIKPGMEWIVKNILR